MPSCYGTPYYPKKKSISEQIKDLEEYLRLEIKKTESLQIRIKELEKENKTLKDAIKIKGHK